MADNDTTSKPERKKKNSKLTIALLVMFCLVAIILIKMTFMLFIVGLLPTIVVYFVDTSPSRSLFHTVMACNLSGVLPFVAELWAGGNQPGMVGMMLSDMQRLLIMYLSAALGWGLAYISPIAARFLILAINERNVMRLQTRQKRLIDEWGQEIDQPYYE